MSETNFPKSFEVNPKDAKVASRYKTFSAEGFVEVAVISAEQGVGSGKVYVDGKVKEGEEKVKRYQQILTLSPLRTPGDFKSAETNVKLKHYLQMPDVATDSVEPDDADEEAEKRGEITQRLAKTLRCFVGEEEIPTFPKKQPNGKYMFDGEEISKEQVEEAKEHMHNQALKVAYKLWTDVARWTTPRKKAFAKIRQKLGNDGVMRPEIHFFTEKLPKDAKLLDVSDWYKSSKGE